MSTGKERAVALDGMGSDDAPVPEILAAVAMRRRFGLHVHLVGDRSLVEREARRLGCLDELHIVHASECVRGTDPGRAGWSKTRSSLRVALELVRSGEAGSMVSAGNTGALLIAAVATLRLTPGIGRPALAVELPALAGPVLLADAGANSHARASHLLDFGRLACDAVRRFRPAAAPPRVALLSNGREPGKGNGLTREAFGLLADSELDFVGHVEPHAILRRAADVVVTDGFSGNAVLEAIEGTGSLVRARLRRASWDGPVAALGLLLARGAIRRRLHEVLDYRERGGAPLLGVNGVVFAAHGRSGPRALSSAIRQASRFAEADSLGAMSIPLRLEPISARRRLPFGVQDGFVDHSGECGRTHQTVIK